MDFLGLFKRKDKQADAMPGMVAVKPDSKERAIADIYGATLTEQRFDENFTHDSIIVTEMLSQFPLGVEEAAMLYANGRAEDAINSVQMLLHSAPNEEILWFLLFDMYCIGNHQAAFEKLALDYARQCEKSPPMWEVPAEKKALKAHNASLSSGTEGQLFSLKGSLDMHMADRIALLQEAARKGAIQLDLSGITDLTPEGTGLLQAALVKLQKYQATLQIASGAFIGLLQQYIAQSENNNCEPWLLLLQLYQIQGKEAEFEDLAVEFAIRFEVSPPSWEMPKQLAIAVAEVAENTATPVVAESHHVFRMSGTINSASGALFEEFKQFSAQRIDIELDMRDVDRVEFASVGLFMDALMAFIPSGKNVTITGTNMMVRVLLITMGIDQMVTIAPHK